MKPLKLYEAAKKAWSARMLGDYEALPASKGNGRFQLHLEIIIALIQDACRATFAEECLLHRQEECGFVLSD